MVLTLVGGPVNANHFRHEASVPPKKVLVQHGLLYFSEYLYGGAHSSGQNTIQYGFRNVQEGHVWSLLDRSGFVVLVEYDGSYSRLHLPTPEPNLSR